ncbi:HNH endonuclease [Streptomyces sp. NBC_01174]|uniref:HNH endonuclease n=1 Tax=Streptomyces sp. NBC_01174 TaxID=2903758 RepID=UPI00386576DC|nr:HNH endonuclease [Streptomyces sp. NBC_01174]
MRSPSWTWDELLLICSRLVENNWRQLRTYQPATTELADLLRSLPLHDSAVRALPEFRSAASISRKSADLITNRPGYARQATRGGHLTSLIAEAFTTREGEMMMAARAIEGGIGSGELVTIPPQPDEVDPDGYSAQEGRLLARWAIFRERNPALRNRKVAEAKHLGKRIQCEVCQFHFADKYGPIGQDYIEVHHLQPLHISGPRETRLRDLAFVCANCHRMCHRSYLGSPWRTPDSLRAMIETTT